MLRKAPVSFHVPRKEHGLLQGFSDVPCLALFGTLGLRHCKELMLRPLRAEGFKYAAGHALQPFPTHLDSPQMKPFCPKAFGSLFIVLHPGKDPPRLPQGTRPAFSSSSQD